VEKLRVKHPEEQHVRVQRQVWRIGLASEIKNEEGHGPLEPCHSGQD